MRADLERLRWRGDVGIAPYDILLKVSVGNDQCVVPFLVAFAGGYVAPPLRCVLTGVDEECRERPACRSADLRALPYIASPARGHATTTFKPPLQGEGDRLRWRGFNNYFELLKPPSVV